MFYIKNSFKFFPGFLLSFLLIFNGGAAQRPPYSLQSAVDELHRREAAKYPLNAPPSPQHFFGALGTASDLDYWDDDSNFPASTNNKYMNRHRLNKALAKFYERENYDADRGGLSLGPFGGYEFDEETNNNPFLDEKKRSSYFRERDGKYDNIPASVFRERDSPVSSGSELTEEFLREIEEAQEREREQHYKDALRQLWEKYQQENEAGGNELFEEKKRMRMPPYYMLMQKKRSYPILPYLPYDDRKKRFPVSKRSTKRSSSDALGFGKTDEKVEKELSEIFGDYKKQDEDKKKRSVDQATVKPKLDSNAGHKNTTATTAKPSVMAPKKDENDSEQMAVDTHGNDMHHKGHTGLQGHLQKEHRHRKRSNHQHSQENNSREEESEEHEEEDEEEEEEAEHEDEHEDEHEENEGEEEEDEARKKKRDLESVKAGAASPVKTGVSFPKDLAKIRKKKSIQWNKYFGIDRKKKSRSDNDDYPDIEEFLKRRQDLDPEKLESMDRKLQTLEAFIIDDTIKYTGAHEGISSQNEIRRLKDHILSRLAAAYSFEKMRRALDILRQSIDNDNHLNRNIIESADSEDPKTEKFDEAKRLTAKKDSLADNDAQDISATSEKSKEIHSNAMMTTAHGGHANQRSHNFNDGDDKKKQKKRNNYLRYPALPNELNDFEDDLGAGNYESLNDAYLGNKNYIIGSNQCPIIESMAERCQGVDLLSGDLNQELLPACGVHQICYLCGTSQIACDYQFLAEADAICGNNNDCQAAARSVLMILRGTPGTQLGPRECLKNPCLYSAMREIGL